MSPRVIGLIAGVVLAMVVPLAAPSDNILLVIFCTLGLVVLFCTAGWLIGGRLSRPAEERDSDIDRDSTKPPARHVFVGAAAAILVIVLFAAPVASESSVVAALVLLMVAVVVGVMAGAASKRLWKQEE